jgi:hypothetical protein
MDWLKNVLSKDQYELLVTDTYVKAFPSATTSTDLLKGEYREMDKLTQLASQFDIAALTIAHSRKLGRDEDGSSLVSVAGTTGRTAAADAILMLSGTPGQPRAKLSVTSRDTEGLDVALTRCPTTGAWVAAPSAVAATNAKTSAGQTKILEVLETKGPLRRSDIEEQLVGDKRSSVGTWLHRLKKDKRIVLLGSSNDFYGLPGQEAPAQIPNETPEAA